MPHIVVEYSAGAPSDQDVGGLVADMAAGIAAVADAKIDPDRVTARAHAAQAANRPFIHVTLRLLPGRSPEVRLALARLLQDLARAQCAPGTRVTAETVELHGQSYSG